MTLISHKIFNIIAKRNVTKTYEQIRNIDFEEVLLSILHENKDSIFSREKGLDLVKSYDDFRGIPVHTHDDFERYVQAAVRDPSTPWLTRDRIYWFALSTGTSNGQPRVLPITRRGIKVFQKIMPLPIMGYVVSTEDLDIIGGPLFLIGGHSRIKEYSGIPVGWMSGISREAAGGQMKRLLHPPPEMFTTDKDRLWKFMLHVVKLPDLRSFTGIPPVVALFLYKVRTEVDRLIDHYRGTTLAQKLSDARDDTGKLDLAEYFPELRLFLATGFPKGPYVAFFKRHVPRMQFMETYSSSEGVFAVQIEPDRGLVLASYLNFYEFIPVDEMDSPDPTVLEIQDVKVGERYGLVVTNLFGWTRLKMGDIVTIEEAWPEPVRISSIERVTRSISPNMNGGSQEIRITDLEVMRAITRMSLDDETPILDFHVKNSTENNGLVLELFIPDIDGHAHIDELATAFDEYLQEENPTYRAAREHGAVDGTTIHLANGSFFLQRLTESLYNVKPLVI